ncbi:MAG: hypothetical protein RLZZ447_1671 [Verrucomicrobiota bacterium]|jgi:hypothetical protein
MPLTASPRGSTANFIIPAFSVALPDRGGAAVH